MIYTFKKERIDYSSDKRNIKDVRFQITNASLVKLVKIVAGLLIATKIAIEIIIVFF